MITRTLKLKLTKKQDNILNEWLLVCSSVYNFGIRKIELNAAKVVLNVGLGYNLVNLK